MAIGTSNIGINAIYNEANVGAGTPANESAGDLFRYSYFEGPNGNNTISYKAWGQYGNTLGSNRIYPLTATSTNLNFGAYSGLMYYYDNSTYTGSVRVQNMKVAPPFPPPTPPSANDFVVEVFIYDSTFTYQYMSQTGINANAQPGGYDQTFTLSSPGSTPLISQIYWTVNIGTDQFYPGGATVQILINGVSLVSTALTPLQPPSGNSFSSSTYGVGTVNGTGMYMEIIIN